MSPCGTGHIVSALHTSGAHSAPLESLAEVQIPQFLLLVYSVLKSFHCKGGTLSSFKPNFVRLLPVGLTCTQCLWGAVSFGEKNDDLVCGRSIDEALV
jgi:hypothetical protein